MDEVLLNTAATLPVMLTDVSRDPVTGVVFGDVTCEYSRVGAALDTLVVTTDNWTELGQGLYTLDFTAGELDILGWFTYLVTGVGAKQYDNTVRVVKTGQVLVTAAYNASTTALVIRSWLHVDGLLITAPTSVALSIRDEDDVERFSFASSNPSAQGVFTIKDTGPILADDHNYIIEATITYGANTYTSGECLLTIS